MTWLRENSKVSRTEEVTFVARGSAGKRQLVPGVHKALDNLKYEIAAELGIPVQQGSEDYWGDIPARQCGAVGGQMVRRMVQFAEEALAAQTR